MTEETITVDGRVYRRFIPYPEPVEDGTSRCIACGQIDEPQVHDNELCGLTASPSADGVDFLGVEIFDGDLETSDKPAGPVSRATDRGKSVWNHELKTHPPHFEAVANGSKTFELRLNDRGFEVGHLLRLREYVPGGKNAEGAYSGRAVTRRIIHMLDSGFPALRPGYVIMGLEPVDDFAGLPVALAEIQTQLPGAFWMLAYGRSRADEPPYGARILFSSDEVLGEGDGETPASAVQAALADARSISTPMVKAAKA
jgi:hypothetical protein